MCRRTTETSRSLRQAFSSVYAIHRATSIMRNWLTRVAHKVKTRAGEVPVAETREIEHVLEGELGARERPGSEESDQWEPPLDYPDQDEVDRAAMLSRLSNRSSIGKSQYPLT